MNASKLLIAVGAAGLIATASLHLALGLPALRSAITDGRVLPHPLMHPSELQAVWVMLSSHLFLLSGLLLFLLSRGGLSRPVASLIGLVPVLDAILMLAFYARFHIAVPLLVVPGLLILAGAFLLHSPGDPGTRAP